MQFHTDSIKKKKKFAYYTLNISFFATIRLVLEGKLLYTPFRDS